MDGGYVDITPVLEDNCILDLVASTAITWLLGKRVTKVLTAEADGIPLAMAISHVWRTPVVVAKKRPEVAWWKPHSVSFVRDGQLEMLYVRRQSLTKKDSVLIVDDLMRSGLTQEALIRLCRGVKAKVAGVFVIAVIGEAWRDRIPEDVAVRYMLKINAGG